MLVHSPEQVGSDVDKNWDVFSSVEQAAGVYHRESRKGRYQLSFKEAKAVCKFEGGSLATYDQLEAARKIGLCFTFWHLSDGSVRLKNNHR